MLLNKNLCEVILYLCEVILYLCEVILYLCEVILYLCEVIHSGTKQVTFAEFRTAYYHIYYFYHIHSRNNNVVLNQSPFQWLLYISVVFVPNSALMSDSLNHSLIIKNKKYIPGTKQVTATEFLTAYNHLNSFTISLHGRNNRSSMLGVLNTAHNESY